MAEAAPSTRGRALSEPFPAARGKAVADEFKPPQLELAEVGDVQLPHLNELNQPHLYAGFYEEDEPNDKKFRLIRPYRNAECKACEAIKKLNSNLRDDYPMGFKGDVEYNAAKKELKKAAKIKRHTCKDPPPLCLKPSCVIVMLVLATFACIALNAGFVGIYLFYLNDFDTCSWMSCSAPPPSLASPPPPPL